MAVGAARRPRQRPRGAYKYLHPRERLVTEIRHHGIVLTKPVLIFLAVVALALWIDASTPIASEGTLPRLAWASVLAVGGWLAYQVFEWRFTRFVVTDKRIILHTGFITQRTNTMPLQKVTDLTYKDTLMGVIFRYGHFLFESAGQDQALSSIRFVPHPNERYQEIVGQIFGLDDGDERYVEDEDDESDDDAIDDYAEIEDEVAVETDADYRRQLDARRREQQREMQQEAAERRDRERRRRQYLEDLDRPTPTPHRLPKRPGASIYRSPDLMRRDRDADTGELPPYDTGELPPYDPDWRP